jgi:hypothetical protein
MNVDLQKWRRWSRAAFAVACSLSLSACFDLTQKLSIDRGGSGRYQIAITANGLLGEALKEKHGAIDLRHNHVTTRTTNGQNGNVTQTATIDFHSLSDLHLPDESLSLTNHGAKWFGLGPSHVTFRRTFLVDRARRENAPKSPESERLGGDLLQTMFGNHTYVFSVTVPGAVDNASPVKIGAAVIKPQVTADGLQHTVTWRMPLYTMLQAKRINFSIDFSAYGTFSDAQSLPE